MPVLRAVRVRPTKKPDSIESSRAGDTAGRQPRSRRSMDLEQEDRIDSERLLAVVAVFQDLLVGTGK